MNTRNAGNFKDMYYRTGGNCKCFINMDGKRYTVSNILTIKSFNGAEFCEITTGEEVPLSEIFQVLEEEQMEKEKRRLERERNS